MARPNRANAAHTGKEAMMKRKTCHAAICLGLLGSLVMQSALAQQQPLDRGWQGGEQNPRGGAQQPSANQPRLQGAAHSDWPGGSVAAACAIRAYAARRGAG